MGLIGVTPETPIKILTALYEVWADQYHQKIENLEIKGPNNEKTIVYRDGIKLR